MYAILDIETTGGRADTDRITEIAVYVHDGKKVTEEFSTLINPERPIPYFIKRMTGIDDEMVAGAPKFFEVAKKIIELTEGKIIVAHNAQFDYSFIRHEFKTLGYNFFRDHLCTVRLGRKLIPGYRSYSLGNICRDLGIVINGRHRAAGDAFATVKLFELLLQKDHDDHIRKSVKGDLALLKLPPKLAKEKLATLPEDTGVYYFYNEKGDIIYIGKSNNIRKRTLQHFSQKENRKTLEMKNEIADISFEVTGSELIALLMESDEIKKHKPRFNRALRHTFFHFGIFHSHNEDGYITFKAARINSDDEPLVAALNIDEARNLLHENVEKYKLCQKLCGLYDISHACFQYGIGQCNGACIGKESPEDYNARAKQLIRRWRYQHRNFFIIGEGRNVQEKSVVAVEAGKYLGFGFVENDFQLTNPEELKFFIQKYADNRDVHRIIRHHLRTVPSSEILSY